MTAFQLLGKIVYQFSRALEKLKKLYLASQFEEIGKHCYLGNGLKITPANIRLGDRVSIGNGSVIQSAHGKIIIGNHVMLGPNVHIHGGNHKIDQIGRYMDDVDIKKQGDDGVIVIEDDVWLGSCCIILKGVHIGRGSVVGAGTIVTNDIPPYSICTNKVETVIRQRFTTEEIALHEAKLYK